MKFFESTKRKIRAGGLFNNPMGMGGCDIQLSAGKASARRPPTGLQIAKTGAGCIKPRIIHTYSPKVYKIKPEEFLDLVQKLTGRPEAEEEKSSTIHFFGNEPKVERIEAEMEEDEDTAMESPPAATVEREFQILKPTSEAVGTPVSNQLLASLTRPKYVTLDFMPMLSPTISSFNQSSREGSFTFPSAAY